MNSEGALPAGWQVTTLGMFKWGSGGTPSSGVSEYYGGSIPWVIIRDLNESVLTETAATITEAGLQNSSAKWVEPGSVLVALYGSIGKAAISGTRLTTNQAIAFTKPDPVDAKYLFYYLKHSQRALLAMGKGATQQNISQAVLKAFPFVLAPEPQQALIVAKIEELFSDLDAGVAALKRAQANLKRYRAAVLKGAVEGRLTAQWRAERKAKGVATEPATQLLARILAERRKKWEAAQLKKYADAGKAPPKGWQAKHPEPAAPVTSNLPTLPKGWCWVTLDVLTEIASGVAKGSKQKPGVKLRKVAYLRVANVQRGFLDLSEIKTITATDADIAELRLVPGDILFNEGGDRDKLGRGWVWNDEIEECIHQNHVFRARPVMSEIQPKFISFHGNSFGQGWFLRVGKQSVNLASINMTVLREFPVPLAPAVEQTEIVAQVEAALSNIAQAEGEITRSLERAARLRQAILKRAFEGRLV